MSATLSRRRVLTGSAVAASLATLSPKSFADVPAGQDGFDYEITRTDAEWREMLEEIEYGILREGRTEFPKSSPLWEEDRPGTYLCRGCELPQYLSRTKIILDKGWAFFSVGIANAQLMNTDVSGQMQEAMAAADDLFIEAHCRRCGSHLGHILTPERKTLHCINGKSLIFVPEEG